MSSINLDSSHHCDDWKIGTMTFLDQKPNFQVILTKKTHHQYPYNTHKSFNQLQIPK